MKGPRQFAEHLFARMRSALALAFGLFALCAPGNSPAKELPAPADSAQVGAPVAVLAAPVLEGRAAAPDLAPPAVPPPQQLAGAFRRNGQDASASSVENSEAGGRKTLASRARTAAPDAPRSRNLVAFGTKLLAASILLLILGGLSFELFGALLFYPGFLLFVVALIIIGIGAIRELSLDNRQSVERTKEATREEKKRRLRRFWRMFGLYVIVISYPLFFVVGVGLFTLPVGLALALAFPRRATEPYNAPDAPGPAASGAENLSKSAKIVRRISGYIALGALLVLLYFLVALVFAGPFALPAYGLGLYGLLIVVFLALLLAGIVWLAGALISAAA